MALKSRKQVREEFASRGWSYTAWAKQHQFSPNLVIAIVNDDERNPKYRCLRGEAHNAAVALGLKAGQISRPNQPLTLQAA